MSHLVSFPPAIQWLEYMALSPSMRTKSLVAAKSRSKSVAVTTISSFSVKRLAVSCIMPNATGITSLRATSYTSRASFSNLSIWLNSVSRSSIGVSSICAFSLAIFSFCSFAAFCTYACISLVLARSWSLLRAFISSYVAFTFSTSGWISFMSRVDLLPKSDCRILFKFIFVVLSVLCDESLHHWRRPIVGCATCCFWHCA